MPPFTIHTDGGSRGNPGPAAVGVAIQDSLGKIVVSFGKTIGRATNNVAEYQAVIAAMNWLIKNQRLGEYHFFLDSQLVINQLNGRWRIKDSDLRRQILKIRQLEGQLNQPVKYSYVPREKNTVADRLVNQALDLI